MYYLKGRMGVNLLNKSPFIIPIILVIYSRQVPTIINIRYRFNYIRRKISVKVGVTIIVYCIIYL